MTKSRFTEVQIVGVLQEHEKGARVAGLCRRNGIFETTFYRWKKKYSGPEVSEVKRLKSLEEASSKDSMRECPAIEVDVSLSGERVGRVL